MLFVKIFFMKTPQVLVRLQREYQSHAKARREVMGKANEALSLSKRAIFAMHRDDSGEAKELLEKAAVLFRSSEALFKKHRDLVDEGAHRAALEEYAEALIFQMYLEKGVIGAIDARAMQTDLYFAGLSDATGEMVRYALRQVTMGNTAALKPTREAVEMIIEFFLSLDLTGYLRNKFDQAKKNLSRLEEMSYDLSIRGRS